MTPSLLLTLILLALAASPAHAQRLAGAPTPESPQFVDPDMSTDFGQSIRFSAWLDPAQPATDAMVFLGTEGSGGTFSDTGEYDESTGEVSYTYTVQPGALKPFTQVSYQFEVTLADGSPLLSPVYTGTYADTRFRWQEREVSPATMHWYEGGTDFGRQAADAATAGLARIAEILPIKPSGPLDVYIYADPSDLQSALGASESSWIAGEVAPEQGAAFVSVAPAAERRGELERQIPHELAHLVHYQLAGSGWGNQPAWLREGIASQAELSANPDYASALEGQDLIPLADLCAGFPSDTAAAFLAYAEADSFVRFLRDNFGASGLEAVVRAYSDGLDCEQGTARALGAPLSELEGLWLSNRAATPPAPTPGPSASARGAEGERTDEAGGLIPFLALLGAVLIVPLVLALSGRRRHER